MYEVTVTHAAAQHSVSAEYQPKQFHAETPEAAAVLYQGEIEPETVDLGWAVERLSDGKGLKHVDKEIGKTVEVKPLSAGERCTRCSSPYQDTPGWQKTTAGILCPDCTVAVCPEDAEPVEREAVGGNG